MKTNNTLSILSFLAILTSAQAHGQIINYAGYSLDTSTDIVKDGQLEWLQWDETLGMSINDALANYSSDGWRAASRSEVASLFNSFSFVEDLFQEEEGVTQYTGQYYMGRINSNEELEAISAFGELFGSTWTSSSRYTGDFSSYSWGASVLFGQDEDQDSLYNYASVASDYRDGTIYFDPFVQLHGDYYTADESSSGTGIALVRDTYITPVPLPAALPLFLSGWLILLGTQRRKLVLEK